MVTVWILRVVMGHLTGSGADPSLMNQPWKKLRVGLENPRQPYGWRAKVSTCSCDHLHKA